MNPETPPRRALVATVLAASPWAALAGVVASLVVRLTVRDSVAAFAVLYFATPLVLDAAAAGAAAVLAWKTGRRRLAAAAAALAAVCIAMYGATSFARNEPAAAGALRGVYWNVEHGRRGWDAILARLTEMDPDVAFIAETRSADQALDDRFRAALPGRALFHAPGGLVVLVRGSAELQRFQVLELRGCYAEFKVEVEGRTFRTVLADLGAHPAARRAPLAQVRTAAEAHLGEAVLIVGDFNTPRDSAELDAWRGSFRHAFETTGRGLDATWPTPVPVLSLDHVWAGGRMRIRTCELPYSIASDHLAVVFTFDVE